MLGPRIALFGTFWKLRYFDPRHLGDFVVVGYDPSRADGHCYLLLSLETGAPYWGTSLSDGSLLHVWFPGDSLRSMDRA